MCQSQHEDDLKGGVAPLCCAFSGKFGVVERLGDALMFGAQSADSGEQSERLADLPPRAVTQLTRQNHGFGNDFNP